MPVSPFSPIFAPPVVARHRSEKSVAARSEFEAALKIQPENVQARNGFAGLAVLAK
jgi:hypothetical protein